MPKIVYADNMFYGKPQIKGENMYMLPIYIYVLEAYIGYIEPIYIYIYIYIYNNLVESRCARLNPACATQLCYRKL